jgi:hypothetical protein
MTRVEILQFAYKEALKHERHRNRQEIIYWLGRYKNLCHELLLELNASQTETPKTST